MNGRTDREEREPTIGDAEGGEGRAGKGLIISCNANRRKPQNNENRRRVRERGEREKKETRPNSGSGGDDGGG